MGVSAAEREGSAGCCCCTPADAIGYLLFNSAVSATAPYTAAPPPPLHSPSRLSLVPDKSANPCPALPASSFALLSQAQIAELKRNHAREEAMIVSKYEGLRDAVRDDSSPPLLERRTTVVHRQRPSAFWRFHSA